MTWLWLVAVVLTSCGGVWFGVRLQRAQTRIDTDTLLRWGDATADLHDGYIPWRVLRPRIDRLADAPDLPRKTSYS